MTRAARSAKSPSRQPPLNKPACRPSAAKSMSAPGFEYVEPSAWLTTATQPTAPDARKAPNKPDTSGRR